jgi:hypothetical protein
MPSVWSLRGEDTKSDTGSVTKTLVNRNWKRGEEKLFQVDHHWPLYFNN